jgi:hypothetical protein
MRKSKIVEEQEEVDEDVFDEEALEHLHEDEEFDDETRNDGEDDPFS